MTIFFFALGAFFCIGAIEPMKVNLTARIGLVCLVVAEILLIAKLAMYLGGAL